MTTQQHPHAAVIDRLGGTNKVARICEIQPPSVSQWRTSGIPKPWLKYLTTAFPWAFVEPEPAGDVDPSQGGQP